ncbi:hypothetical protein E4U41_003435 [Claviceps citrina]|nr:hypothetical protein E4U41_003435 [Claviceps citrina]
MDPMDPTMMSGGNDGMPAAAPALGDDSRLEQPTDAVPMENMSRTPTAMAVAADVASPGRPPSRRHVAETVERPPSTTVRDVPSPASSSPAAAAPSPASESRNPTHGSDAAAPSSKGKEKDEALLPPSPAPAPAPPAKERSDDSSVLAIGPAQDDIAAAPGHSDGGPVCNITLLLTSGSRHPYRIDARYLTRRNIAMPDETDAGRPDPFSISIYTLKELILREWRNDWEAKPASPSSIRLIHFGKLLDDKEQLKKYHLSTENPNVIHMSIRPQDLDEEEPKSGSKSLPTGSGDFHRSRSNGMCCAIL